MGRRLEPPVRTHLPRLWPLGARGLLIVLALIAALGLRFVSHSLGAAPRRAYQIAPVLVIDPNTAPPSVLGALPHVGPALVRKLVEQREIRPFDSTDDLRRRVRGFGPVTLARLAPHLRIRPRREPIDVRQGPMTASVPGSAKLAQRLRD
jgi:hypothetical protein